MTLRKKLTLQFPQFKVSIIRSMAIYNYGNIKHTHMHTCKHIQFTYTQKQHLHISRNRVHCSLQLMANCLTRIFDNLALIQAVKT